MGFLAKIRERRVNGKYSLVNKIGEGGHAAVYLGRDFDTGEEVALKMEHRHVDPSILAMEAYLYEEIVGLPGFPKLYTYEELDDYKILALQLLGPSLEDVFAFCGGQLSLKTALMVVDQLLDRIEALHSRGYLHRDIKPENCLLGTGADGNVIYLTDFGLADAFFPEREKAEEHNRYSSLCLGTLSYASIRAHTGARATDDLESLLYTTIYLIKGRLPWQDVAATDDKSLNQLILEMKKDPRVMRKLFAGLPREFQDFLKHLNSIPAKQSPDYARLRDSFRGLARKDGIEYDNIYDWTELMYLQQQ